jgi:hypothetical protein
LVSFVIISIMEGKSLYDFYEKFLLPQFGIKKVQVEWARSKDIGPDETVHYFSVDNADYALIFEDAGGLGNTETFVKESLELNNSSFEYVNPISHSDIMPSYPVSFPTPYQYCANVTGVFTLVKL